MDRCTSCQNILPRTVDRCPVCGLDNAPAKAEVPEVPEVHKGKDFLDSIGSKRIKTGRSPRISSPRSGRTPERTGHDGAVPLYEPSSDPAERESDFDLPELGEQTRSVAAISSRLNSNIRIGPRRSHTFMVTAAALVAVASLGAGTAIGLQRTEVPSQIAMTALEVPVRPSDEPLVVDGPVEGFDPAAIVSISETPSCGAPIQTYGAVVEGGTVVAPLESTQNGETPAITGDRIATDSDIIGLSNTDDLAVLRPADRLERRLRVATTTRIRTGTTLALVSVTDDEITLRPAIVSGFETRDGTVHSFTIQTKFEAAEVTTTESFASGTFVVDQAGDLLGMADNSGSFVTALRISESVARFQTSPTFPEPVCG